MRVIYNTCFADPWIKVAEALKEKHGITPVYWNGYDDDNSEQLVNDIFPEAIYHPYFDAWKGIFPKDICNQSYDAYINIDFLKQYAEEELQAITMMDRMDADRTSFSFAERKRHYRNLVRYWSVCIEKLKPKAVISAIVPHRVYDYVLYLLCEFHNIPYITFRDTAFSGRIIPLAGINSTKKELADLYGKIATSNQDEESLLKGLDKDIVEQYEKVMLDYSKAQPYYMKRHVKRHAQSANIFQLSKSLAKDILVERRKQFLGKDGYLKKGFPTYHKEKGKSIEQSHKSILQYSLFKIGANRFKKKLKSRYTAAVSQPDYSEKYIILNLHYQPEMTSCPSGSIFADQQLCVDILMNHLPEDYKIYVKEHPAQFYSHEEGHTARLLEFYDDLKKYDRVKLIGTHIDSFKLTNHSQAVATVTGTVGWEAMALGKPVIIFGTSWYERYKGVLKITDEESATNISSFIHNFTFNRRDLLAYLRAFNECSLRAYYYRGLKERMNQPEEECISSLTKSILNSLNDAQIKH